MTWPAHLEILPCMPTGHISGRYSPLVRWDLCRCPDPKIMPEYSTDRPVYETKWTSEQECPCLSLPLHLILYYYQITNAAYFGPTQSASNGQLRHCKFVPGRWWITHEWVSFYAQEEYKSWMRKPTSYPRRGKKFSFFVILDICSVLSIWMPKKTALKMFKMSPTCSRLM